MVANPKGGTGANSGFAFGSNVLCTRVATILSGKSEVTGFACSASGFSGFFRMLSGVNRVPLPRCVARGLRGTSHCRAMCTGRLKSTTTPATNLRFAPRILRGVGSGNMGVNCMALRMNVNAFEPIGARGVRRRGVRSRRCRLPGRATSLVGRARGGNKEIMTIKAAYYHALRDITACYNRVYRGSS